MGRDESGMGRDESGMGRDESAKGWDESAARACHQPLVQADQNVVPVAVTAGDKIESLRQWAAGRCLSADRAGVYSRSEAGSGGRVRRVVRAD
jgi:hypothetical protein